MLLPSMVSFRNASFLHRCLVLAALLLAQPALADAPWKPLKTATARGEVSTWNRSVEGYPIKQFKGVVEVPYSALNVLAVIRDVPNFPDWVFQCQRAEQRSEWGVTHTRIMIKGIWPVSDRDVVVNTAITQDPATLAITVASRATDAVYPPQRGYTRLPELDNRFVVEPLADGWSRVTFETFVDPGGSIPTWLSNFVATKAPLTTLQGLHAQLEKPAYRVYDAHQLSLPDPDALRFPATHLAP